MVEEIVPRSKVVYAEGGAPDTRCYRVACEKLPALVPSFQPAWTVRRGIEELYDAFMRYDLTLSELESPRLLRIQHVKKLQAEGTLDAELRRSEAATVGASDA
jgi:hypothetical protein